MAVLGEDNDCIYCLQLLTIRHTITPRAVDSEDETASEGEEYIPKAVPRDPNVSIIQKTISCQNVSIIIL